MWFCYALCLFLLTFILPGAVSYRRSGCPSHLQYSTSLKTFQGTCYQFLPLEKDWYVARDYCREYGGKLVSITNSETNEFLKGALNSMWWRNNGIWIGLNDLDEDGTFTWVGKTDRSNLRLGSWSNWGSGHPGAFLSSHRDCIRMVRDSGAWKWHETPCKFPGYNYRFICQYETVQPVYSSTTLTVVTSHQRTETPLQTIPVNDYILIQEPVASLQQGHSLIIETPARSDTSDSSVTQVALLCLSCILVVTLVIAFLIYRRRQRRASDDDVSEGAGGRVKNGHLENSVSPAKVENIYVDEATQKFLKAREVEGNKGGGGGIYEEIPYDLARVGIAHV